VNAIVSQNMFFKTYKLLKDTPETPTGTLLKWDLWREIYSTDLQVSGISKTEETFTRQQVEEKREWFEPLGEAVPFFASFPENFDEHFYFGELRHNQMCRFCTVAHDILSSKEYRKQVTIIFKSLYEKRIVELAG